MVGYNKDILTDFVSVLDGYSIEDNIGRNKVRASFYKIIMADEDMLLSHKKEAFSTLLLLYAIYSKKGIKNEKLSYATISENKLTHELNRALYSQKSLKSILMKPSDVPTYQLLAMKMISESKFSEVIALLMVYFNYNLQDLIVENEKEIHMIKNKLFTGNSFATLEEIIDGN